MHVPDGLIPLWLLIPLWVLAAIVLYHSIRMVKAQFDESVVPTIGVLAAVVFAAQFVNFPIYPSSGHLVGSTLVAVIVGPWAGILIIAVVLLVQALYGDGGAITYSLNFFNMGTVACITGWVFAVLLFKWTRTRLGDNTAAAVSTAIAAYIATVVSAAVLGIEVLTVPGVDLSVSIMLIGIHAVIAIGEALLTFLLMTYFVKARPTSVFLMRGFSLRLLSREPVASQVAATSS